MMGTFLFAIFGTAVLVALGISTDFKAQKQQKK